MDPDPGGLKTYRSSGSGSATLVILHKFKVAIYSLLVYREASPESSEADRRGGQTPNKPS
jgi:hypothetical protein